jgi:hypothetical protein
MPENTDTVDERLERIVNSAPVLTPAEIQRIAALLRPVAVELLAGAA